MLWLDGLLPIILHTDQPPLMRRQKVKHLKNPIAHILTKWAIQSRSWRPRSLPNALCSISGSCAHLAKSWTETVSQVTVEGPLAAGWEHCLPVSPGVTTVLSMTTLMIGSRTSLPNTNCFIKAIDVYLGICFSFVFGALLEYAIAHYSSLQQMAAKDRVRILKALCMIHHLCHGLVGRDGLDLVTPSLPPYPHPSTPSPSPIIHFAAVTLILFR